MEGAVLKSLLDFSELFNSALRGDLLIDVSQYNGACSKSAAPVVINLFFILDAADDVLKIGLPVDTGGNDEGVRASLCGASVVGNVGNACSLTSGGSAH